MKKEQEREKILKEIEHIKDYFAKKPVCYFDEEKSDRATELHRMLRELDESNP